MSVSAEKLQELGVGFDLEESKNLLPFTSLCVEEFELIHEAFGVHEGWSKRLSISIGKGICYTLIGVRKETSVEVVLSSPSDCFAAPMTIEVVVSHEPESKEEHQDGCPFSFEEWPKDEKGIDYWADENSSEYDEETDTWTTKLEDRIYEPECFCDWVEDERKSFILDKSSDMSLEEASAYVLGVL